MNERITYIGLEVYKETIAVALARRLHLRSVANLIVASYQPVAGFRALFARAHR